MTEQLTVESNLAIRLLAELSTIDCRNLKALQNTIRNSRNITKDDVSYIFSNPDSIPHVIISWIRAKLARSTPYNRVDYAFKNDWHNYRANDLTVRIKEDKGHLDIWVQKDFEWKQGTLTPAISPFGTIEDVLYFIDKTRMRCAPFKDVNKFLKEQKLKSAPIPFVYDPNSIMYFGDLPLSDYEKMPIQFEIELYGGTLDENRRLKSDNGYTHLTVLAKPKKPKEYFKI